MDLVWMIIVVVLMGVLPDLLRRKRRYPRSKGPIPVPPRRKPAPAPKMEAPEPTVPEPSFPDWDEGWDNMNFPDEPEPALPKRWRRHGSLQNVPGLCRSSCPSASVRQLGAVSRLRRKNCTPASSGQKSGRNRWLIARDL